nr:MAG TPA: hypothetical protein [Caudoviricetes sp.]
MPSYLRKVQLISSQQLSSCHPIPSLHRHAVSLQRALPESLPELCLSGLAELHVSTEYDHGVRVYVSTLRARVVHRRVVAPGSSLVLTDTAGKQYLMGLPWRTAVQVGMDVDVPSQPSESIRDVLVATLRDLYPPLAITSNDSK